MSSTTKNEELAKQLKEKGVDVSRLVVCFIGTDQILGESTRPVTDAPIAIKNPKRVVRIQQFVEGGIVISLMIGDLDFVTEGLLFVKPAAEYYVQDQSEESQTNVYESYLDYFKRKVVNKAKEAGIVMPGAPSPFRK